ncbi:hypothetical protein H2200_009753 [Cladophialophora chaetospira]|uniref:Heterokaryon incompatibility domain-containing protein n=1 Tax=Cladophialophora chaetospira TaxID=386627 RepID=A0AA38X338_9EURO|nr:hypothetical protein H2200_009753 [Cladophialophora chaetospira]
MEVSTSLPLPNVAISMAFDLPKRQCQAQHTKTVFGNLCSVCDALDVAALLAPANRDIAGELRAGIQLGTLPQLRDCASHCRFCRLIVDQVPSTIGPESVEPEHFDYKEHSTRTPAPIDHWKYSTCTPEPNEIVVSLRSFRGDMEHLQDLPMMKWDEYLKDPTATWLEILLHSGGPGFRTPTEGMAITCQKRLVPYLGDLTRQPLAGRMIPSQVQYSELKGQLEACLQNHQECFLHDFNSEAIDKHFWLIDTVKKRVVLANQNVEYAALSYVWGDVKPNYEHLKGMSSPSAGNRNKVKEVVAGNDIPSAELPQNLPKTISDAIEFCCGLDMPYLWVDSICIAQDNQEMKDYLIQRMNHIYMKAKFTIIAAAGQDANAGLPGVRAGTRIDERTIVNLHGTEFTTNHPPVKRLITESVWFKRAWTYQEGWLSPRCFIFTPQEVLFCCTQSTSRESWYSCSSNTKNGLATRVFQTHEIGFPTGVGQIGEESRISSLFNNVLRLYHRRQLTFEVDKIKAIQGCINAIAERNGIPSWHGMPMQWASLAGALIWRHSKPSKRTNLNFPSYSWASWDVEPVYFREFNVFHDGFANIYELESAPNIPKSPSGCPALSFTGEVALLHIKPGIEDIWYLDEQKHLESAPGAFAECYPGDLSAEEVQRLSTAPCEFLGIAKGFHWLSNRELVMAMMIERKEGYVVRRTVLCMTFRAWQTAKRTYETVILL